MAESYVRQFRVEMNMYYNDQSPSVLNDRLIKVFGCTALLGQKVRQDLFTHIGTNDFVPLSYDQCRSIWEPIKLLPLTNNLEYLEAIGSINQGIDVSPFLPETSLKLLKQCIYKRGSTRMANDDEDSDENTNKAPPNPPKRPKTTTAE